MKGLKKFRLDNNVSIWYMSRLTSLSPDQYVKYEGMKDESIPSNIKNTLESVMSQSSQIKDYYDKAEDFYLHNSLKDILFSAGYNYDTVAETVHSSIDDIKSIFDEGQPFPDANTRDKLIDLTMWIKENNEHAPEVVSKPCIIDPSKEPNKVSPEEIHFPELPSPESVKNDTEGISKDDEIACLNRQIEWYEELLGCFTHLAELAYKNNK